MDGSTKKYIQALWSRLMKLPKRAYKRFISALLAFGAALVLSQIRLAANWLPFAVATLLCAALLRQSPIFACAGLLIGCLALGRPVALPSLSAVLFTVIYYIFHIAKQKAKPCEHLILFALCQFVALAFLPAYTFHNIATSMLCTILAMGLGVAAPWAIRCAPRAIQYIRVAVPAAGEKLKRRRLPQAPRHIAVKTTEAAGESSQIILQTAEQICKTRLRILHE